MAQFLCCIPLATVDAVLAWLKPQVPKEEQQELLAQVGWQGAHATWTMGCRLMQLQEAAVYAGIWGLLLCC